MGVTSKHLTFGSERKLKDGKTDGEVEESIRRRRTATARQGKLRC
jgi:hypothetical protein